MLKFYRKNHPYSWIEKEMRRYDEELRLVWDTAMGKWKAVRKVKKYEVLKIDSETKIGAMWDDWAIVRVCQWDQDMTPRAPGQWLLHSLFDGRIRVTSPEQAVRWMRDFRKREEDGKRRRHEKAVSACEGLAREGYKHMEAEYVTVDGLKK